jgi:hypothetical protein
MGGKFRDECAKESVIDAISMGLTEYINKLYTPQNEVSHSDLNNWKQLIMEIIENQVNQLQIPVSSIVTNSKRYLLQLQQHFTISPVDKLSHNLALTSKFLYKQKLIMELQSEAYEIITTETKDQVLDRHQQFNETTCTTILFSTIPKKTIGQSLTLLIVISTPLS